MRTAPALLRVLHRLVDAGNTVVLIEHHLDMMKNADWIIDLGPGAGDAGGSLIATGTPEDVTTFPSSHTGRYLREVLSRNEAMPVSPESAPKKRQRRRSPEPVPAGDGGES